LFNMCFVKLSFISVVNIIMTNVLPDANELNGTVTNQETKRVLIAF